jgi:DNA-binding NtrC family response regulator
LKDIKVTARVIAATHRNLFSMVQDGSFREDLYYRLRQFAIITPELRGDPQDIALIAQKLWAEITKADAKLPQDILEDLCGHRWPGNVRELRSVLSSLANFFGRANLRREHLNAVFQHFGLVAGYGRREAKDQPNLVLMDCLRHIHRSDEALHACQEALRALADGLTLSEATRDSLARSRVELEGLLRQRLYFGRQEVYQAVLRVAENLAQLLALPRDDHRALSRFWQSTLAVDLQEAVTQLFREHEKLLSSIPTSGGAGLVPSIPAA